MKVYIGQARGKSLMRRLQAMGFGEMTVRGELPPRRYPWAFDNGAYRDWTAGSRFDEDGFMGDVEWIRTMPSAFWPEFVVAPDIVAGGMASLEHSNAWISRLPGLPLYLAVQDGMEAEAVAASLPLFAGLFVGGTLGWKIKTGATWVELAHSQKKPCHIGRVGTENRVRWARRIGADSVDSCLPLWSEENLQRFLSGLTSDPNQSLFSTDDQHTGRSTKSSQRSALSGLACSPQLGTG